MNPPPDRKAVQVGNLAASPRHRISTAIVNLTATLLAGLHRALIGILNEVSLRRRVRQSVQNIVHGLSGARRER